jgi:(S)-2-hydroxy-acid oxidase
MANRGVTWDPLVHTIQDLKDLGSKKLPKMYRDYFNEGAMDLVRCAIDRNGSSKRR